MVTLWIINLIANCVNNLLMSLFGNLIPTLSNLTSFISNYSVPQTIYDTFSLVVIFLPMGTISVLALLTFVIIAIKFAIAVIHVLTLGVAFGE